MTEQHADYTPETITPAVTAQRGQGELMAMREALEQAKSRADALSAEPESALREVLAMVGNTLAVFRMQLTTALDDVDAAIEVEASRVDAELRKEQGQ